MQRILCLILLVTALICSAASAAPTTRPNVLWLIAEDIGPEVLSSSGTPEASTPVLDRFASQGVSYTRAYTTAPVCSPSRSAIMTGMYAGAIGAQEHRTQDKKPLPAPVRTLCELLHDAGYYTGNIERLPARVGFRGQGKTDLNFKPATELFDTNQWGDLRSHQPFYAQINFNETHRTFHAPEAADPAKVQIPPYYPDHPVTRRDWAKYLDSARELDRKVGLILDLLADEELADNTIVVFVGDNGQAMVRGKQFCYEEGLHVPLIIRWPKSISAPQGFRAGIADERLLEAIDLTATTLSFAGIEKPSWMQGRVFLGPRAEPAREYVFAARDRCDETVMRIRTVRDKRYRYIRNLTPDVPFLAPNAYKQRQYPVWTLLPKLNAEGKLTPEQAALCAPRMPEEELYDLEADPHEIHNLVASSNADHKRALERLGKQLDNWLPTIAPH